MLFDKLCGIVERHLPDWRNVMGAAKIFEFEDRLTEVEINLEFMWDRFFLPFQVTAMESPGRLVILNDLDKNNVGLGVQRGFVCILASSEFTYKSQEQKLTLEQQMFKGKPGYNVISGVFQCEWKRGESWSILPALDSAAFYTDQDLVSDQLMNNPSPAKVIEQIINSMADEDTKYRLIKELEQHGKDIVTQTSNLISHHLLEAISRMAFINTPDRFVVEIDRANVNSRKPKTTKIPRSDVRPKYVILRPDEIRRMIGVPQPGNPTVIKRGAHERRRHFRTFHSDKFVNKKGQTIIIPATWIGPSEAVIKNKRYKVLFDI